MNEIANASIHFYTSDLLNRTVTYFGKTRLTNTQNPSLTRKVMLFNPYKKMTNAVWEECRANQLPYLVAQTFRRAFPTYRKSDPTCILLTPCHQFQPAAEHHQKQNHDPLATMLRLDTPRHLAAAERCLTAAFII